MAIILETERLVLRRFLPEDLDALFGFYSDPEVTRYIPDAPRSYEETRKELEWFLEGHPRFPELGLWATIHKGTGQFIGRCGLIPWTIEGQHEVEVAFALARDYWGQGLASEVATALVEYGYSRLGLRRLICVIEPQHQASIRVASKIGMAFERSAADEHGPFLIYARHKTV
jgi:ribosomal-protein-alanine N-acetyltransferase